ncbi:hypothetical protein GCM10020229_78800 [Kitasatospora albolonga]|uniref:hypothetical protein n=1 Tax=Kitasatospora albolonga TaxID=68173 RepID=UPI0031EF0282
MADRVEALDRVKALVLLPDGVHVTARMIADYYGVGEKAVDSLVYRHRAELAEHGHRVLKGADLREFLSFNLKERSVPGRGVGIFPRRAVLVVGMLLRGSTVAKAVRRELLDLAERAVAGAAEWRYELSGLREELAEIRELQLVMLPVLAARGPGERRRRRR